MPAIPHSVHSLQSGELNVGLLNFRTSLRKIDAAMLHRNIHDLCENSQSHQYTAGNDAVIRPVPEPLRRHVRRSGLRLPSNTLLYRRHRNASALVPGMD